MAAKYEKITCLPQEIVNKWKAAAKAPHDKVTLQRQTRPAKPRRSGISATDREIDRLVYELYGLTEEEIKIVEGTNQ